MTAQHGPGIRFTVGGCLFGIAALMAAAAGETSIAGMNVAIGMALIVLGVTANRRAAKEDRDREPKQSSDEGSRRA